MSNEDKPVSGVISPVCRHMMTHAQQISPRTIYRQKQGRAPQLGWHAACLDIREHARELLLADLEGAQVATELSPLLVTAPWY